MKKIYQFLALAAVVLLGMTACSPESFDGPNGVLPLVSDYEDNFTVTVDDETNYATFTFHSANGVSPVWILDDGSTYYGDFTFRKYYRKAGDYSVECRVKNANGISDGSITKTFHVAKTKMTGFGGFDVDSEYNMFTQPGANLHLRPNDGVDGPFWYAPDWSQIADPAYVQSGNDYTLKLPTATKEQWQCQMFLLSDISLEADKTYDFSVILTSNTDHPHVTVKVGSQGDGGFALYYNAKVVLKAGEPLCVWASDLVPDYDIDDLMLVFDFGGNAADTEINIENLVLKDHANDDGTVLPEIETEEQPVWVDVTSDENIWNQATWTNSFYYAPNWSQIADPTLKVNGRTYIISLPEKTYAQWQAQCAFNTNLSAPDTEQEYDFCVNLMATEDVAGVTVKLVQTDEKDADGNEIKHDGNYFFAENVDLKAYETKKFWVKQVKAPEAMHAISLFFDFGGNPAGTEVEISDIIFQKHKE